MTDLHRPASQQVIADIIGVSQPAVSGMIERGIIHRGDTLAASIASYCAHLREVAAGRMSADPGGLDPVQESSLLKRARREGIELDNAKKRGEQAPIEALGDCLAKIVEMMVASLDQIDGAMAKSAPDLPEPTRLAVLACVVDARNKIAARGALGLVVSDIDPDDDIDADEA